MRQQDGSTLRAHLSVAAKQGNARAIASLTGPGVPEGFGYLWQWFLELHTRRGSGGMGPAGISWTDLNAWARFTGADPSPWELDMLSALDATFFDAVTPAKKLPADVAQAEAHRGG